MKIIILSEYTELLIPVLGLILNVTVQIVSRRYILRTGILKSMSLGFVIGFLSVLAYEIYFYIVIPELVDEYIAILIVNLITYSLLGFCYCNFVGLGISALRTRILKELDESKEGLTLKECLERYTPEEMLELRIKRMVSNGQVVEKDGKYCIGLPITLFMAKVILIIRLAILGKKNEFD